MSLTAATIESNPEMLPGYDLAAKKYFACSRLAIDEHSANLHVLGDLFYHSLYSSGHLNGYADPLYSERFPDRHQILTADFPEPSDIPEKEIFIEAVKRAVTRETDSGACVYPGSIEQMAGLMMRGSVVIWTAGDTLGTAENPGSMVQHAKIAATGLSKVRTEVARETGKGRTEILKVLSAEDKLSDEIINRVEEMSDDRQVFVMDDRLQNLVGLQARLPRAIAIWVQQDKYGMKIPEGMECTDMAELQSRYNAVNSFNDVGRKVDGFIGADAGDPLFLVDFDGTLINSTMLAGLQQQAVLNKLSVNGWL